MKEEGAIVTFGIVKAILECGVGLVEEESQSEKFWCAGLFFGVGQKSLLYTGGNRQKFGFQGFSFFPYTEKTRLTSWGCRRVAIQPLYLLQDSLQYKLFKKFMSVAQ